MRRRKFAEGGYTDQEASDLMLNDIVPKRESIRLISDEPATPQSAADQRAEDAAVAREAAREARASAPRPAAPRATAPTAAAPTPRSAPKAMDEGSPEAYTAPKSTVAAPAPVPRMPIERLIEKAQEPKGKVTPRPRMIPSADEGPRITSRKPKPMSRAERLERDAMNASPFKKGGSVGASKRGDGIAQRGKTKGRML